MSPVKSLPGQEKALELGYTIHSHGGNYRTANYTRHVTDIWGKSLMLRVWWEKGDNLKAMLSSSYKSVRLEIGPFSFPYPKDKIFRTFEKQILKCLPDGED